MGRPTWGQYYVLRALLAHFCPFQSNELYAFGEYRAELVHSGSRSGNPQAASS